MNEGIVDHHFSSSLNESKTVDLSGKHSNMPVLQGNKNVIWSQQTPLTEISENFKGERE